MDEPEVHATADELAKGRALGMPYPYRYALWVQAGFTDDQIAAWYPLTRNSTLLPELALRLLGLGWTPESFSRALAGAHAEDFVAQLGKVRADAAGDTPAGVSAPLREAALWHEVTADLAMRAAFVQSLRDDAVRAARDAGASMPEIGAALGLSKQRVAAVLKAKPREIVEREVNVV